MSQERQIEPFVLPDMSDIKPGAILLLRRNETVQRMVEVWPLVGKHYRLIDLYNRWSAMAVISVAEIKRWHGTLTESGICMPNGEIHPQALLYLQMLAMSELNTHRSKRK